VVIGGWMYWDAELHSWRIAKPSILPWQVIVDAFERETDRFEVKCRPCDENAHAECEGADLCICALCRQIAPVVHDLEEDWDRRDREKQWRD
jgi:hypothetical protein